MGRDSPRLAQGSRDPDAGCTQAVAGIHGRPVAAIVLLQGNVEAPAPPIDSDVVCLLSDEYATRKDFSADVWKGLARSVQSEAVPG